MTPWLVAAAVATALTAAPAHAQIRGFADVGTTTFTATESFDTILGTASGIVFGGGVEGTLPFGLFANLRVSRFTKDGERVFLFEGERFDLGIPTTVTVTPIELAGGYRFDRGQRLVPYAGGGVGWHQYRETSEFADASENVQETFTGYHVLGGVELRARTWMAVAGELQWATVPDALGQDPNGVSAAFDETDLGGVTVRVKLVIGR